MSPTSSADGNRQSVSLHGNGITLEGQIRGRIAELQIERNGTRLGAVEVLLDVADDARARITCRIDAGHRRQGVATAAVRAVRDWALDHWGVHRLEAFVHPENTSSLRTAIACGFRAEGLARGVEPSPDGPLDLVQLAVLATDPRDPEAARVAALRSALPRRPVAAGLVVRDETGRALVVQTSYKVAWEVVGGVVERGEPLAAACRREVLEELGVALPVGDLLVVDACTDPEMLAVLFDGGVMADGAIEAFTFPDGEILRAVWADRDTIRARCGARVAGRLVAALDAFDAGRLPGPPLVLADGRPDVP